MKDRTTCRHLWTRRAWPWLANLAALVAIAPLAAHVVGQPVRWNQLFLHRVDLRFGCLDPPDAWAATRTLYTSGWNVIAGSHRPAPRELGDLDAVFAHVFSWLPGDVTVYPTEGFYYFRTEVAGRRVAGNFRVADLDRGVLSFAYFDRESGETWSKELYPENGLGIEPEAGRRFQVSYGGRTVLFRLRDMERLQPRRLHLLPEEELVAGLHDESGLRFFLLFNRQTDSFYYVLNEERGVPDRLDPVARDFEVGERTGFLFYRDPDHHRALLLGLDSSGVRSNDYLDGPPDQVPFRARLRSRMIRAYPSAALGAGIDEHGVRLGTPQWERMVIVALNPYVTVDREVERFDAIARRPVSKSILWTALTKEAWNDRRWLERIETKLAEQGETMRWPAWVRAFEEAGLIDAAPDS